MAEEGEARERRLTFGLLAACLAAGGWALLPAPGASLPVSVDSPPVRVTVSGRVLRPGPIELPFDATVARALEAAGGLAPDADASFLEPDRALEDGDALLVPALTSAGLPRPAPGTGGPRLNLNRATPAELEALPGIGPALAGRIGAARPFASLADLDRVRGIGPSLIERLKPLVLVP